MDDDLVIVKRMCDQFQISEGEALYYLEGFEWNFDSAMEACRNKISPPLKDKSWPDILFNEKPDPVVSPTWPIRLNSRPLSIQNQPKEPAPEIKKELIDRFRDVAYGMSLQEVVSCLEQYNWDVTLAVHHFFEERYPQKRSAPVVDDRPAIDSSYLRQFPDARIPMIGVSKLDGFSEDETSAALAMDVMDHRAPPLPCLIDLNMPDAIPLMASSQLKIQVSSSPAQNKEEELHPPTKIDRICAKIGVSREEAHHYLEEFNWDFASAMEACRIKNLPPVKIKTSPGVSVNVKSAAPELESPSTPVVIYSHRISTQRPEQLSPQLNKDERIGDFLAVASGASVEQAIAYLNDYKWDVSEAILGFTGEPSEKLSWPRFSEDNHSTFGQSSSFGSSSSSMNIDLTMKEESLKEDSDQSVTVAIPPMALSQENKKLKGEAVEEDSSTKTITLDITFTDSTVVEIPFRPDQTVRDIYKAIEALRPDISGGYYIMSKDLKEYTDMNTTVHTISTGEYRSLYLMYPLTN